MSMLLIDAATNQLTIYAKYFLNDWTDFHNIDTKTFVKVSRF